jgi:hypothetical protein
VLHSVEVEVGDVLVVTRNAAAAAGEARQCGVLDGILAEINAGLLLVSRAWMTRVPSCVEPQEAASRLHWLSRLNLSLHYYRQLSSL